MSATAAFPVGQLAVAVSSNSGVPAPNGAVFLFTPDGVRTFLNADVLPYSAAFDASQRLWFSERGGANDTSQVWSTSTTRDVTLPIGGDSPVFDAAGNLYVLGGVFEPDGIPRIYKYSPAGALLASYQVSARTPMSMDLAADQCTMFIYYDLGHRAIGRYDVCTGTPLADVPIDPALFDPLQGRFSQPWSFRILADNSLLVPVGSSVLHVAPSGDLLRTYTVPGLAPDFQLVAVALDPSASQFWVGAQSGDTIKVSLLDVGTGTLLAGPFDAFNILRAMTVSGEPRAGLVVGPASAPALSSLALLALAVAVAGIAIRRLS